MNRLMERRANKVIDVIADARLSMPDIDAIGYHIINLSNRKVRANALALADSIMYHETHPFSGDDDDQYTLF